MRQCDYNLKPDWKHQIRMSELLSDTGALDSWPLLTTLLKCGVVKNFKIGPPGAEIMVESEPLSYNHEL
jgi:hypothetical protein